MMNVASAVIAQEMIQLIESFWDVLAACPINHYIVRSLSCTSAAPFACIQMFPGMGVEESQVIGLRRRLAL